MSLRWRWRGLAQLHRSKRWCGVHPGSKQRVLLPGQMYSPDLYRTAGMRPMCGSDGEGSKQRQSVAALCGSTRRGHARRCQHRTFQPTFAS